MLHDVLVARDCPATARLVDILERRDPVAQANEELLSGPRRNVNGLGSYRSGESCVAETVTHFICGIFCDLSDDVMT